MLRAGIVGLPNVGKSTLFNALTKSHKAETANYPFCTIAPNVGVVEVPDPRLGRLAELSRSRRVIPAAIELVDIAGLVAGASQGEGLGNQFLAHIREVDAIIHLVRCFTGPEVHHVAGSVDPVRDIEVIHTELALADLATLDRQREKKQRGNGHGDPRTPVLQGCIEKARAILDRGMPLFSERWTQEEKALLRAFQLLTMKPTLYACNVAEEALCQGAKNPLVEAVVRFLEDRSDSALVILSSQLEAELPTLLPEERESYLQVLGVSESGVTSLIQATYRLLGLRTFFTSGEKETRAWTIRAGDRAPQAAGVIHSDFERGFIAAECASFGEMERLGSFARLREAGRLRVEGKDYVVEDGDVIEFRFNV
ncbi:Ribosome-binding ATPase YchF [Methylacidimicrobium cyclopophantes]|uniref:Ribosome-binding ATPase YchF n=1 Tax=Methylacidimicrobium cyclopophantes TaxID=1041766 RepID=A0A5E6MBM0_9BACT|nr:redox-regulated ATPase YchF [Methylacidimicrobium cyclopophantes]VVM06922.1 Ribosome-binding ATPase YchF [Methylacidimicrobium cyclopophantes]